MMHINTTPLIVSGHKALTWRSISHQSLAAPRMTKRTCRRQNLSLGTSARYPEDKERGSPHRKLAASVVAGIAVLLVHSSPSLAVQTSKDQTLFDRGVERCSMEQLKKGAKTRAGFSDFAGEPELLVNIEGCDYSAKDLSNDVLSGVRARGANFADAMFGKESSRADFRGADMHGAKFRNTNLYATLFNGADLRGADFESALLTLVSFGFDKETGKWANLEGANFEDALLSSSDVKLLCQNPTILEDDLALLGCLR